MLLLPVKAPSDQPPEDGRDDEMSPSLASSREEGLDEPLLLLEEPLPTDCCLELLPPRAELGLFGGSGCPIRGLVEENAQGPSEAAFAPPRGAGTAAVELLLIAAGGTRLADTAPPGRTTCALSSFHRLPGLLPTGPPLDI